MQPELESSKTPSINRYKGFMLSKGMEIRGFELFRKMGYIILALFFVDFFAILIPPHFMDSFWELAIINSMLDRIWIALLGFGLIFFYRADTQIKRNLLRVLYYLSWLSLILSIFYFLLFPLTLFNAFEIYGKYKNEKTFAIAAAQNKSEQIKSLIESSNSAQDLTAFIQSINPQKVLTGKPKEQQLKEIAKQELVKSKTEYTLTTINRAKSSVTDLFKTTTRAVLGTLLSGLGLGLIWKNTRWVRVLIKKGSKNDKT